MKIQKLYQRGDTIVEVLLAIAVLSFVLAISYGLASSSSQTNRQAQERSEAQKITEEQLELLRGFASNDNPWKASWICLKIDATNKIVPATAANECAKGPAGDPRYKIKITYDPANNSYTVTNDWFNVKGGQDNLKLAYKLPITDDIDASTPPAGPSSSLTAAQNPLTSAPSSTTITWDPGSNASYCDATNFTVGGSSRFNPQTVPPPLRNFDTGNLTAPKDYKIRCYNNSDTPGNTFTLTIEFRPLPPTVSPSSYEFPAWHLYNTGGLKPTKVFTVKNDSASPGPLNLTAASLSGANTSSYSIISDGCASKTLTPGGPGCNITVQFFPPSGGANNRLANAGEKNATLTINNSDGVASSNASLSGWAVTDTIGPGDSIGASNIEDTNYRRAIRGYNTSCYNNAFNCPIALVLSRTGSMALHIRGSIVWQSTSYSGDNGGGFLLMGGDGNFQQYSNGGVLRWATLQSIGQGQTQWRTYGAWIKVFDSGQLWLMHPPYDTSNSGIWRITP